MSRSVKLSTLLLVIVIVLATISFCSCSSIEQSLEYQDTIESRYLDGFTIDSMQSAPLSAVEYKKQPRVTKTIVVDNRVVGLHTLGLYLPKNETLSIRIDSAIKELGYKIVINSYKENGDFEYNEIELNQINVTKAFTAGGIIELYVADTKASEELNTFSITISGAIESSFYRLGARDNKNLNTLNDIGNYAVLDATNFKMYIPIQYKNNIDDVEKLLKFYRSAMVYMDNLLGLSFNKGDYSPLRLVVDDDKENLLFDATTNTVYINSSNLDTYLKYEIIKNTQSSELFTTIAEMKVQQSEDYNGRFVAKNVPSMISTLTQMYLVDMSKREDNPYLSYNLLNQINTSIAIDTKHFSSSIIANLYNIYGRDKIYNFISCLKNESFNNSQEFALFIQKHFENDLTALFNLYGISFSEEELNEINSFDKKDIVATKYSLSYLPEDTKEGVIVNIGEVHNFDFTDSIFSIDDGWEVENVAALEEGRNPWHKKDDGTFDYYPSEDYLEDNYVVVMKNGDKKVYLYGHITVEIRVGVCSIYEDVRFKDLESAKKSYEKGELSPKKVVAVDKAQTVEYLEAESGTYTLVVTEGSMQVQEDGNYTFFLKNSGLCSVDFGVPEYIAEIFNVSISVVNYTYELEYDIYLQKDKLYYYTIYSLISDTAGGACLGIKKEGQDYISDLSQDMIVYKGLKRDKIVHMDAPVINIEAYEIQQPIIGENNQSPQLKIISNLNPNIVYVGDWRNDISKYVSIDNSISESYGKNSYLTYTFYGDYIAIYGVKGLNYGIAEVKIDGKDYTDIDFSNSFDQSGVCLYATTLENGEHTVRIDPKNKDNIINIDYLAIHETERPQQEKNISKLYYMAIIPAVFIITIIGALIADKVVEKKKNKVENK